MNNRLNHRLYLLATVALLLVNSCKNDGCNDPVAFNYDPDGTVEETCLYEPKSIDFTVRPVYGDQDVSFGDDYKTEDNRTLRFTYYGIYLSNLSFAEAEESEAKLWSDQDVMLLKNDEYSISATYLNKSEVSALHFDVGIDTAIYDQDPTTSELIEQDSPLAIQVPSMYWGWAGGYRFISLEGEVDTSAALDGSGMASFAFHCGLPANLKRIELPISGVRNNDSNIEVGVNVDFQQLLSGIDFTNTPLTIHTGDHPTTVTIMNNAVTAFEIQ